MEEIDTGPGDFFGVRNCSELRGGEYMTQNLPKLTRLYTNKAE